MKGWNEKQVLLGVGEWILVGGGKVNGEDEGGGISTLNTCMKIEKCNLLRLF
jgi:hypothetical protein